MDNSKHQTYRSKADWAQAKADQFREQARSLRYESSAGSTFKARGKYECIRRLQNEAARFDQIAMRLRKAQPAIPRHQASNPR